MASSIVHEIAVLLDKLQHHTSSEDVIRFSKLISQHGKMLSSSELNEFMKIVFITVRNVLKRSSLSTIERMHLLKLLEFRSHGWMEDPRTTAYYDRKFDQINRSTSSVELANRKSENASRSSETTNQPEQTNKETEENIIVFPFVCAENEDFGKCDIKVKNKFIGMILGQKGCRSKAITKYTRTYLVLENTDSIPGQNTLRNISIKGTQVNVRRAIILIKLLINGEQLPDEVVKSYDSGERISLSSSSEKTMSRDISSKRSPEFGFGRQSILPSPFKGSENETIEQQPKSPEPYTKNFALKTPDKKDGFFNGFLDTKPKRSPRFANDDQSQGKQLSDSGLHEDLSPVGKGDLYDCKIRSQYKGQMTVKGHIIQLMGDSEELLQESMRVLKGHFQAKQDDSPTLTMQQDHIDSSNDVKSLGSSAILELSRDRESNLSAQTSEIKKKTFPFGRGRARLNEVSPEPQPKGLSRRGNSGETSYSGNVSNEDKNDISNHLDQESIDSFIISPDNGHFTGLLTDEKITSTPAISDDTVFGPNFFIGKRSSKKDCMKFPLSSTRNDSFMEIDDCSYTQEESKSEFSTLNRGHLFPEQEVGYSAGIRQSGNKYRDPIQPFTSYRDIKMYEKEKETTSMCAAIRRELFAATAKRRGFSCFEQPAEKRTYSRECLIKLALSPHAVEQPKKHWRTLTKIFPDVCLDKPWGFSITKLIPPSFDALVKEFPKRHPVNNQKTDRNYSFTPVSHQEYLQGSGDVRMKDQIVRSIEHAIPQSRTQDWYKGNKDAKTVISGDTSDSVGPAGDAHSCTGDLLLKDIAEGFKGERDVIKLQETGGTTQLMEPVDLKPGSLLWSSPLLDVKQIKLEKCEEPVRHIDATSVTNSNDLFDVKVKKEEPAVDGFPNEPTTPLPNILLDVVQEAIDSFNAQCAAKPVVTAEGKLPVRTSKWNIRPEGVKESVADVIIPPGVCMLRPGKTCINAQRLYPNHTGEFRFVFNERRAPLPRNSSLCNRSIFKSAAATCPQDNVKEIDKALTTLSVDQHYSSSNYKL